MRVEAPVAGAKGLMQRVDAKIRATLPRQAQVTRTEGNSVWVKFPGDGATDPESKFPSTVAGVPPATMGWVITLGGRKGLFVATGISQPIPFSFQFAGGRRDTTSITTPAIEPRPQDPPMLVTGILPGAYRMTGFMSGMMARSVQSGLVVLELEAGGYSRIQETLYDSFTGGGYVNVNAHLDDLVTVNESGEMSFFVGYRGGTTAGTTYLYKGVLNGTLTRIG